MTVRIWCAVALGAALLAACGGGGGEMGGPPAPEVYGIPDAQSGPEHRVAAASATNSRIDARLHTARGQVDVWVSLDQDSVAAAQAAAATAAGLESAKSS